MPRYRIESRRYLPEFRGRSRADLDASGDCPVVYFGDRDIVEVESLDAAQAHFAAHLLPLYAGNLSIDQFVINEIPPPGHPGERVVVAKLREDR